MSNLLISEPPLQLLPGLAVRFGLNEAIFLQQLHYWLNNAKVAGKVIDGRKWISNSVKQWRSDNFPFWSEDTIQRAIKSLIQQGAVSARKDLNSGAFDRTNWYTINYDVLDREPQLAVTREPQVAAMEGRELPPSLYTETTKAETTTENTKARARVDRSPVAQSAAPAVPTPPAPALTQSEIDGFAEATNVRATAPPPPCDAPPPDPLGFRYASDDPPPGPKHRQFDPRQLVGGLYPAGFGQTAYEIYRESFAVTPTHKQIQHMTANVTDLDKWRTITEACALKGWKSYSNVFDAYQNGFREQKGISDGNGGKNFGRNNGQNSPSAFAQQSGPKRFDPYDRSTWDREMLATFDPISLAEIEQEERERGLSSM